jgi:hypothetical protein
LKEEAKNFALIAKSVAGDRRVHFGIAPNPARRRGIVKLERNLNHEGKKDTKIHEGRAARAEPASRID